MTTSTATLDEKRSSFPVGTVILVFLVLIGFWAAIIRYTQGLGAATNLSDTTPWGLWIAFDVMAGVALAAGGFTLAAVVYIFRLKRFYPLMRPTLLTAWIGYILAAGSILFDLGRPERFWHPFIYWNIHSVMFEIAWSVLTYLTILTIENSALVLERFKLKRLLTILRKLLIPIVILGIIISTMHQSSLGGLFVIVPGRLHPLWHTMWLPVLFYISAIMVGLAMVIVESILSAKAFNRTVETHLLSEIGSWIPWVMVVYLALNLGIQLFSGKLPFMFEGSVAGTLYLLEIVGGVIVPLILLFIPAIRQSRWGLFWSAALVVFGVVLNRFNVAFFGQKGAFYAPSWIEYAVTIGLVSLGVLIYMFTAKNFAVLDQHWDDTH